MHSENGKPKSDNGAIGQPLDHELAQFGTGVHIEHSNVDLDDELNDVPQHTAQASQHQSRKASAQGHREQNTNTQSAQFVSNASVAASE